MVAALVTSDRAVRTLDGFDSLDHKDTLPPCREVEAQWGKVV